MPVRNEGEGGSESPDVAARVLRSKPHDSDVVVIEPFLNDVRRFGGSLSGLARYEDALVAMLSHLRGRRVAVLLDPEILAWKEHPPHDHGSAGALRAYGDATRRIATAFPIAVLIDIGAGWNPSLHVAHDGVHPSGRGTRHIADKVIAALK